MIHVILASTKIKSGIHHAQIALPVDIKTNMENRVVKIATQEKWPARQQQRHVKIARLASTKIQMENLLHAQNALLVNIKMKMENRVVKNVPQGKVAVK